MKIETEELISLFLKLEQKADELKDEIENDDSLQLLLGEKNASIQRLQEEIATLTEVDDAKANLMSENKREILEELKTRFDGINKSLEFDTGAVNYRITKTTIINDPVAVAEGLQANGKLAEGIKTFDLKVIRSFLEAGLLEGAASFEEKVNVKVTPPES